MPPEFRRGGTVVRVPDGTAARGRRGYAAATRAGPRLHPHPSLRGRSLLTLRHHEPEAVAAILELASHLRATVRDGWPPLLAGKVVALVFERPSTRTRVSFASGIARLGGTEMVLSSGDMQLGRGETIEDTAKVLGRMVDAIMLRTGPHADPRGARPPRRACRSSTASPTSTTPARRSPTPRRCSERFGDLAGLPVAYLGDGNNCCVSLMIVGALTGMDVDRRVPARLPARPRGRGVGRRGRAASAAAGRA